MDGFLQPLSGSPPASSSSPRPHPWATAARAVSHSWAAQPPPIAKTPGDYLRSLRKRYWIALTVAFTVSAAGAVWVGKLPAIYKTTANIQIDPPEFDPVLQALLPDGNVGRRDPLTLERYIPNCLYRLRNPRLAEKVVNDPRLRQEGRGGGNPAAELVSSLTHKAWPQSSVYDVSLEGRDPARVAATLNILLETFAQEINNESLDGLHQSASQARQSLKKLHEDLAEIDRQIASVLVKSPVFAPDGKNLLEARYESMTQVLDSKRIRHDDLKHQSRVAELYPHLKGARPETPAERRVAELQREKSLLLRKMNILRGRVRDRNNDPLGIELRRLIADTQREIDAETRKIPPASAMPSLADLELGRSRNEIHQLEKEVQSLLDQLRKSMPAFQEYSALLKSRDEKSKEISQMRHNLGKFELLLNTQNAPVKILVEAPEPTSPVRPSRTLYVAIVSLLGVVSGLALVCLLERLDRSIKVPEHLSQGLGLPLLGVVPRMRRLSVSASGGHLRIDSRPRSIEADAYRNLRAGLLGLSGSNGPAVTLLVTSAKAGEGKSTTALNLAATCAGSGERTLLIDVDLRRPSLSAVFGVGRDEPGLIDVLRGRRPWQSVLKRDKIQKYLDFLPCGPSGDVPIEILGTLETRQLIAAVSKQYDRVILDAPAVLGLADCRMLGRMVDAAVLVVRSGAHELRPLARAKAMLDQSRVPLAGVVFNALAEDYHDWSSYGPTDAFVAAEIDSTTGFAADDPRALVGSRSVAETDATPV